MRLICPKNACTGCGACAQICPTACITMQRDAEGFERPVVDLLQCSECGLCVEVCPMSRDWRELHDTVPEPSVSAAWHLDAQVRRQSTSGGVFTALANSVLRDRGVVFGARFTPELALRHVCVRDNQGLAGLRGAKYLQSTIGETYREARNSLEVGSVLFSGTPCQIAGLYSYLGGDHPNLLTVDLLCFGVASPRVFVKYLAAMQSQYGDTIRDVRFRDKEESWRSSRVTHVLANGKQYSRPKQRDPFMVGFSQRLYLRPCCAECRFTRVQRIGDITLGDFWGIRESYPEIDDDRGISQVLANTDKGQRLLQASESELFLRKSRLEDATQPNMQRPSPPSHRRRVFFDDLPRLGFRRLERRYLRLPRFGFVHRVMRKAHRTAAAVLSHLAPGQAEPE